MNFVDWISAFFLIQEKSVDFRFKRIFRVEREFQFHCRGNDLPLEKALHLSPSQPSSRIAFSFVCTARNPL